MVSLGPGQLCAAAHVTQVPVWPPALLCGVFVFPSSHQPCLPFWEAGAEGHRVGTAQTGVSGTVPARCGHTKPSRAAGSCQQPPPQASWSGLGQWVRRAGGHAEVGPGASDPALRGPGSGPSRSVAYSSPTEAWSSPQPRERGCWGHEMGLGWGSSSQVPPQPRHRQGMVSTGPQASGVRNLPPVCPEAGMQWAFQECSSDRP